MKQSHRKNLSDSMMKIFKYKKYQDFYDRKALECIISLVCSMGSIVLSYSFLKYNDVVQFTQSLSSFLSSMGLALIGFLGFIVTGLAILTGAISSKVVQVINSIGKKERLDKILLSFYFLGVITLMDILLTLCGNAVILLDIAISKVVLYIYCFITTYCIVFVLAYAVKLIGNCLDIFSLVNDIEDLFQSEKKKLKPIENGDIKKIYDGYRITALEFILLQNVEDGRLELYLKTMKEQINEDESTTEEQKIRLIAMYKQHFGL